MQRIGFQRLARRLARHPAQGPRPAEINQDGTANNGNRPPGDINMLLPAHQPFDRLKNNPCGGEKQQSGFNERRNALRLGVPVMVLFIRRLVAPAHRKPGDDGGPKVDQAVNGFRQNAERAGGKARGEFGDCQPEAGKNREDDNPLFFRGRHGACITHFRRLFSHKISHTDNAWQRALFAYRKEYLRPVFSATSVVQSWRPNLISPTSSQVARPAR